MLIDAELFLCGSAGFLISAYIALVYFGLMSPAAPFVPRFCRLEEGTCRQVIRGPEGKMLGLPNSLFGLAYYGGLIVYALAGPWQESVNRLAIAASVGAILYSTYLVYVLLWKLRVDCRLCYAAHALNAIIGLVMIYHSL